MNTRHKLRGGRISQSQQGMASIVITMVTMVVISLIVLGFATISRREARQSLDQLQSTQAFYAAESGVEDARKIIKNQIAAGQAVPAKSNCTTNDAGVTIYPTGNAMKIDAVNNIEYTCLQIDPNPDELEFDGISGDSTVIPLNAGTQSITAVEISWQPNGAVGSPVAQCPTDTDHEFAPQSGGATNWTCGYGVLRVDLVPTTGGINRAGLGNGLYGGFFQPVNYNGPNGRHSYAAGLGQANLTAADCDIATYDTCVATITNIPAGYTSMSLRLSSIYQTSDIKVRALGGVAGNTPLAVNGVQAEVDVTGKAADVLRRIKVRLPLVSSDTLVPGSAITSNGSICKRFETTGNYFNIPSFLDPDPDNEMCEDATDGTLSLGGGPSPFVGNAAVSSVPRNPAGRLISCTVGCPVGGFYSYQHHYANASTNPAGNVVGCTWDFGDGVVINNIACYEGNTINHTYPKPSPEPPYPLGCDDVPPRSQYTTTLTVRLVGGLTYTDTRNVIVPWCYYNNPLLGP